jgi:hypothetical protein
MKHGTVKIGEWTVPLIGVPETATLETCDLCGIELPLREIIFTGRQFLCGSCGAMLRAPVG